MARIIVLDSTPLGLASGPQGRIRGDVCRAWLNALKLVGVRVFVPEVADYEVRRELLHIGAHAGLKRLAALESDLFYDPITTPIMRRAAELWADARRRGLPTAGNQALDADAILAAQAILLGGPGDSVTVATSNGAHLARFAGIDAREWATIT